MPTPNSALCSPMGRPMRSTQATICRSDGQVPAGEAQDGIPLAMNIRQHAADTAWARIGGHGHPRHAPLKGDHKHQVQRDVEQRGQDQEVKRRAAVPTARRMAEAVLWVIWATEPAKTMVR